MNLRLSFLGILLLISALAQAQSSSDWEKYLNASFLPAGNAKAIKQIDEISDSALRGSAQKAQGVSEELKRMSEVVVVESNSSVRKEKESTGKKQSTDINAAAAPSAEADFEKSFIPIIHLPDAIAQNEQNANLSELKTLYSRYKNDYPIHPAAYVYAKEMLKSLPPNAILLTQGHLDTYPILADQASGDLRKDVLVINLNWLKQSAYRKSVEQKLGENPGWNAQDAPKAMINKLIQKFPQRLYLSMTIEKHLLKDFSSQLHPLGLAFSVQPVKPEKHHDALSKMEWGKILESNLPEYMRALHSNYLAALLIDEKLQMPVAVGQFNRTVLLNNLYQQTGLKKPAENYLKN